jgi:hypothetical protein
VPATVGRMDDETKVIIEDIKEGEDEEEDEHDVEDDKACEATRALTPSATTWASTPSATTRAPTLPPVATSLATVACSGRSSPSSLSPHALHFFPIHQSTGRSKFRRWEKEPCADSSDDELASATRLLYLDAARHAFRATPPSPAGAPDAAQNIATVADNHLAVGIHHCRPRECLRSIA